MSKAHRGKGIRELVARGRGECPVCHRSKVKVLYELEGGALKVKVCKTCKAAIAHGKKQLPAAAPVQAEVKAVESPAAVPPEPEAAKETPAAETSPAADASE
ncbi:MAG: hypothetical protein LBJ31_02840 [Treponema sp.]|jgi:RNA polymerase subunit RPABC4/transcription elongation factor Spt4|nr:hypothetical protein [Treponema sp.]